MTGWEKVIAVTLLVVVAMGAFNIALWRRMRIALANRPAQGPADFDSAMVAQGCAPEVPPVVRDVLSPYYLAGTSPAADDVLEAIGVDREDVGRLVAEAWRALGCAEPAGDGHGLRTVGDLARYLSVACEGGAGSGASLNGR